MASDPVTNDEKSPTDAGSETDHDLSSQLNRFQRMEFYLAGFAALAYIPHSNLSVNIY